MRLIAVAGVVFSALSGAFAQSFEVASVKLVPRDGKTRPETVMNPGRVSYTTTPLRTILMAAYGVKSYQIAGPGWLNSNAYDIVAKLPADAPASQIPAMLQRLLVERFELSLHHEDQELPVYALLVNKGGGKLKEADPGQPDLRLTMSPMGLQAKGKASMPKLAESLSQVADRPIVDLTELVGVYDIDMTWESDDPRFAAKQAGMKAAVASGEIKIKGKPGGSDEDNVAASLFAAVQQKLGLKLDPRKLPVDVMVIDRANPVPAEN